MQRLRYSAAWVRLACLSCALCAGCDRLVEAPEWNDWAVSAGILPGPTSELPTEMVGAAVLDLDPTSTMNGFDPQTIRHGDPCAVVEAFLNAVKRADSRLVRQLLTERSREACASSALELAIPRPTPLAEFRVSHAEYLPGDQQAAHVRCVWTDSQATQDFIFVLRLEPGFDAGSGLPVGETGQWRVAGLVAPSSGGVEVFDLETPDELLSLLAP